MKIEFIETPIGRPEYKTGDVKEFVGAVEEGYARKYIDRGWAKEVRKTATVTDNRTPAQKSADAQREAKERIEAEEKAKKDAELAEADRIAAEKTAEEAKRLAELSAVQIPHNWGELAWNDMRALASSVTDEPVKSKDDAVAAIEAELKRREAAAA